MNLDLPVWHHYAVTHDGGSLAKLYVDGVLYATVNATWTPGNNKIVVGQSGATDEFTVYAGLLSAQSVERHYAIGATDQPCDVSTAASPGVTRLVADGATSVWRVGGNDVVWDSVSCRNGVRGFNSAAVPGALVGDSDLATLTSQGSPIRMNLAGVTPGSAVTLEFWSKGSSNTGWLGRIGNLGIARIGDSFWGNQYWFAAGGGITRLGLGANNMNLDASAWHHYAITHDGVTKGKVFVDGVLYTTIDGAWTSTDDLIVIGESAREYDDVALYPSALTATQIGKNISVPVSVVRLVPRG